MIGKYVHLSPLSKPKQELISKLDNSSRKTSSLEENIYVTNHCVTEENFLWLQKGVEVKVLTETFKK